MTHTVVAVVGVVVAKAALAYATRRNKMKITKKHLKRIILEELGSDPEGEAASFARLRKAKSAEKLNTSVEEVEIIADLMANDPEFRMFRNFVDKFKRYSQSGGAVASSLEAALPEYMPGKMIARLVAKAQESLTGDETPMAQPKSPAASAADMDNWESDYRNESKLKENNMKITKNQLKQIIKEELIREAKVATIKEGFMDKIKNAFKKGKKTGGEDGGPKAAAAEMVKSIKNAYGHWENQKDKRTELNLLKLQKAYDQLEDKFMDDGSWSDVSDVMEQGKEWFEQYAQKKQSMGGPKRKEGSSLSDEFGHRTKSDAEVKKMKQGYGKGYEGDADLDDSSQKSGKGGRGFFKSRRQS